MTADHSDIVEIVTRPSRKFGNIKILTNSWIHISLGPDCTFPLTLGCLFLPAFCFFLVAGCFMINYVHNTTENFWFRLITIIICTLQPLSYLSTALVDPGFITESVPEEPGQTQ